MAEVFRIEKSRDFTVMSNHHFKNKDLSLKAKGLLSQMLSLPESWDYSLKGLVSICKEGKESINKALNELEEHGYLTRTQVREKGRFSRTEFVIREVPVSPCTENRVTVESPKNHDALLPESSYTENRVTVEKPPCTGKPYTVNPLTVSPCTENLPLLNTKDNKELKELNTKSIYPPMYDEDEIEEVIRENIEYDILLQDPEYFGSPATAEILDNMVEIIKKPFLSSKTHHRIGGDDIATECVRSRLLKLDCEHIKYVFDCVFGDTKQGKIKNIGAYLLTALYNAPTSCTAYYMAM